MSCRCCCQSVDESGVREARVAKRRDCVESEGTPLSATSFSPTENDDGTEPDEDAVSKQRGEEEGEKERRGSDSADLHLLFCVGDVCHVSATGTMRCFDCFSVTETFSHAVLGLRSLSSSSPSSLSSSSLL